MSDPRGAKPSADDPRSHARRWRDNVYVYPVISRRSGGLSVGINLNPDKACNFDCVYCQVDRTASAPDAPVRLDRLREELADMLGRAASGALYADPAFASVEPALRVLRDIAFSGDGEPTACLRFAEAVELVGRTRDDCGFSGVPLVLITNATLLARPHVRDGLARLDRYGGQVWAKLDAGSAEHYRRINRSDVAYDELLRNILDAARVRPLVIQSLWLRWEGAAPADTEIDAFADRLSALQRDGARFSRVQVYTLSRRPTEPAAAPLDADSLALIARRVTERTGLTVEVYA